MSLPIVSPAIPFLGQIPNGLTVGTQIIVEGHVPEWFAHQFDINLVAGHNPSNHHANNADIALHFNPRFDEHYVVLNTKRNRSWDDEVRVGSVPIRKGSNFEVMITVEPSCFRVTVNGSHFANFNHRMPFQDVGLIWITGKCDVFKIEFRGNTGGMPVYASPASVYPGQQYRPMPTPAPIYPSAPPAYVQPSLHHPHHHAPTYHVPRSAGYAGNVVPGFVGPAPVRVLPTPSAAAFGVTYSSSQGVPLGAQPAGTAYSSSQGVPLGSQPAPGYPYR